MDETRGGGGRMKRNKIVGEVIRNAGVRVGELRGNQRWESRVNEWRESGESNVG